jgi:tetratricopeptide (TPR) repeat protein
LLSADELEMDKASKADPVKTHREGTALYDSGNYKDAIDKFLQASQMYLKIGDFFDSSYSLFKAAECSYLLKDYETAAERFLQAADKMLKRGFDRFGLGALEYVRDCYKAWKRTRQGSSRAEEQNSGGEEETRGSSPLINRCARFSLEINSSNSRSCGERQVLNRRREVRFTLTLLSLILMDVVSW